MLSCHHSYCKDCINHLPVELDNGRHVVKCPSCRHPTQLSEREAADLPTTFHINGCLEIDQLLKTQIADNEDRCAQDKAVQFPLCKAQQQTQGYLLRILWKVYLFQVQHWVPSWSLVWLCWTLIYQSQATDPSLSPTSEQADHRGETNTRSFWHLREREMREQGEAV